MKVPVTTLAVVALLALTAGWGSTFFMVHDLTARIPPGDYLFARFGIAALVLTAIAPLAAFRLSRREIGQAIILGMLYAAGQILQTEGLARTSASVAGFVTGLYVVLTPLFAAPLLRTPIHRVMWFAVVLATVGMGVLSLDGLSVSFGVILVFISAVVYALQIVGLGAWSKPSNAMGSSVVQLWVITVICGVCAAPHGITLPMHGHLLSDWSTIIYTAVIVGALGLYGQVWAQAHLDATRAALIMAMEPVFAALFAIVFGSDHLTGRMVGGGLLVLAAMILSSRVPEPSVQAPEAELAR